MANNDLYDIELWRYPGQQSHIVIQNLTWQQLDYIYHIWMDADMKNDCFYTTTDYGLLEKASKDSTVTVLTFEEFSKTH